MSATWTGRLADCPVWCELHGVDDEDGMANCWRYVSRITNRHSGQDLLQVVMQQLTTGVADFDRLGPSLSVVTSPGDPSSPPLALYETDARDLVAGLQAALAALAEAMPETCPRCGEHCIPRDGGLCWRCETDDVIAANVGRREQLRMVR